MQRGSAGGGDAAALHRRSEAPADVAIVEARAQRVGEDEGVRRLVRGGEPALAQELHDRRSEDHFAPVRPGLQWPMLAPTGELEVDADQLGVEVDVSPAKAERLTDCGPV